MELATEVSPDALDPVEVLRQVGLAHRLNNFPSQLSGGEQQRVSIARALAKIPNFFYVMNRQARWILKRASKY